MHESYIIYTENSQTSLIIAQMWDIMSTLLCCSIHKPIYLPPSTLVIFLSALVSLLVT